MQGINAARAKLLGIALVLCVFVIVQVALAGGTDSRSQAKTAGLKGQINKLKQRVASLEAKPDQVGQAPATLPPSGAAGGELSGSYPNPQVGTVAGLDLASSTSSSGGVNFGSDTNLYRNAASSLRTDDTLIVEGSLGVNGPLGAVFSTGLNTTTVTAPELGTGVTPQVNQAVIYADDTGMGKTRLFVQFPTGAPVTLATEP